MFSSLRANDLIWPYVVNSYLKGKGPPAFDLLYWNSDATNLPGPMFCWYVRHTYLQNDLREAREDDAVRRAGRPGRHRFPDVHLCVARGPHRAVEDAPTSRRAFCRARTASCWARAGTSPASSIRRARTSATTGPADRRAAMPETGWQRRAEDPGQLVAGLERVARAQRREQGAGAEGAGNGEVSRDRARARALREGEGGVTACRCRARTADERRGLGS